MAASKVGVDFIKKYEGFRSKAYQDSVNVWTIGYGSTMWSDGRKVQPGQVISLEGAEKLLAWELENKGNAINSLLPKTTITQNQFDALASFTYNLGVGALTRSTLIKKVRLNPKDTSIKDEFMRWVNAGGKPLEGLIKRRAAEAALYFKP